MADDAKRNRLKAALRENLKRRKAHGRDRDAGSAEPAADTGSGPDSRERR